MQVFTFIISRAFRFYQNFGIRLNIGHTNYIQNKIYIYLRIYIFEK